MLLDFELVQGSRVMKGRYAPPQTWKRTSAGDKLICNLVECTKKEPIASELKANFNEDTFRRRIDSGQYDRKLQQFKDDLLDHYGKNYESAVDNLLLKHSDKKRKDRMRETLSDLMKAIGLLVT